MIGFSITLFILAFTILLASFMIPYYPPRRRMQETIRRSSWRRLRS